MASLLPFPRAVEWRDGVFCMSGEAAIALPEEAEDALRRAVMGVRGTLAHTTGLALPLAETGAVTVALDAELPAEGYVLDVGHDGVHITAADYRGAQWAAQTLLQLAGRDVYLAPTGTPLDVRCVRIEDAPRFARRGAMLDVSRHFMPVPRVLDFVDWLARHKLNVFHWHLTDDQGWRIALDAYPRLATHASWRTETSNDGGGTGTPHGGCYTLDQIRAVADYARQRGIEIVPEVDFPGHVSALLRAYPEFAVDPGQAVAVPTGPDIYHNVLNLSDECLDFVHYVLDEVIRATGATYVHIGGDEVPTTLWETTPAMAERAQELGVEDPAKLQRWFTLHLRDWLVARGVTPIGWDEVAEDGSIQGMVCQAWRGSSHGIAAANAGMDVIMGPDTHTYLDHYASDAAGEPYAQPGTITLERAYSFDPLAGFSLEAAGRVIGTQFQLWTEFLPTYEAVEYAAWPRGCALAEVAWSAPEHRDYAEFTGRLSGHLERMAAAGVNLRPLDGPHPWQEGGTGWRRRSAQLQ